MVKLEELIPGIIYELSESDGLIYSLLNEKHNEVKENE